MSNDNWQNRITGYKQIPAHELLANPANARRHPAAQREALRGSLDTLGWVAPVIINTRTGYMLDGHARTEELLTKDDSALIPVIEVDLSEDEEKLFLASYDYITQLADYDRDSLDALLADVSTDDARLQTMLTEMAEDNGLYLDAMPPSLDDLKNLYGTPEADDFWPIIRAKVSPDLYKKFQDVPGENDDDRMVYIIEHLL